VGRIETASRRQFQRIIEQLAQDGAQAVIFGCTELTLLLQSVSVALPVFDSKRLHAQAAVAAALDE
jgi:aspartate racemase